MKKFLLSAVVMLFSMAASAQNEIGQLTIAPTVGINFANLSGDIDGNKMKIAPVFGAVAEYGLAEKIGISAGALFSMQGCKYDEGDEALKANFLNIPILANYYVADGIAIKAGVQPAFLMSAKVGDEDIKDGYESFELSIPVGASYEVSNFVIDARYNIPLTKLNKEGDKSIKNSIIQVTLGYKFAF
jgi:hypothetical protein